MNRFGACSQIKDVQTGRGKGRTAFDTVDHEILCQKLVHYGVQQRELAWFRSYLCNRKQFCRVNGVSSKIESIDVGVPQGSCLGPLLFLIYINDLPQAVQNSAVSMYADDTSLCYQSSDIDVLNEAINNDLKQLDTWLQGNKLSLNVAKTNSMLVSTKQKHNGLKSRNEDLDLKIRNNELEIIQKTKYLGVQIDNSLNWKEHIKTVSTKVSRAIGFLKHAKTFLPKETLKTLYTAIVEPHLRYCCSVWGCAGSTELNQLQKLQNRAARIITNSSFDTPSTGADLGGGEGRSSHGQNFKTYFFPTTYQRKISDIIQITTTIVLSGLKPQKRSFVSFNSMNKLHEVQTCNQSYGSCEIFSANH